MNKLLQILFIEDSDDDMALQVRLFENEGYDIQFERVDSPRSLLEMLDKKWDLIISDYSMPNFNGKDALRLVRTLGVETPFIFVSGTIGEETAVAALKEGAQNYLMKSNLNRLVPTVERELREAEQRRERKHLEKQVNELQRFESIGRLAGGVAHDFNNVIGAIMGWAEMGLGESAQGSSAQERFQKIKQQADRAAGLTRQLLAFARRQILQPRAVDLNQVVRNQVGALKNIIGRQNTIQLDLPDDVRPIWADPTQIEQVVINLSLNAQDAMPDGGCLSISTSNVELTEECLREHLNGCTGSFARLRVEDTGTGIDPKFLDQIFEPFFTTKETGRGLGLATVHGIVKQHEGFVEVGPGTHIGTRFSVYLPLAKEGSQAQATASTAVSQQVKRTILMAEDHEEVRETTRLLLEGLGYRVLSASNGAEAVELLQVNQNAVDLALLDVVMPVLTGPDASLKMASLRPDLPFLFVSGHAHDHHLAIIQSHSTAAVLQKPYDGKILADKVREMFARQYK